MKSENIIYEYQEVTNSNLKLYIENCIPLHIYFKKDWGKLKTQQYCGILNHNGEDFYILLKIANHDNETNLNIFIYMLIYAYGVKVQNE